MCAIGTIDSSTSSTLGTAYPVAPWRLRGWGFASVHLTDVAAIRHLVPQGLRVARVLPGKTLSALYFASYKGDSTLVYHELAIAVAVVSHAGHRYAWAPQLYVDDARSVAGGRAIWGLHKTLASFERTRSYARATVTVRVDGREIVSLAASAYTPQLSVSSPLPTLGIRGDAMLPFAAAARGRVRLASATVALPDDSPYRPAFARRALIAARFDDLVLEVPAPQDPL